MNVLVAGFPYVRERYFATFRHWPERGGIRFLLPDVWTAKDGRVVFHPPADANVATTRAYFHHSHYPVIGGLLKGWMPAFPFHLWRQRHRVDLVYSCSEPTLLTTFYQAFWSKLLGKRHVCFSWENIPYEEKFHGLSRFVHFALLTLNLALSDGLVCGNSESLAVHSSFIIRHLSFRKPSFAVIPMNGLDPVQFTRNDELRRNSHLSSNVVYTFVGAIGYRKGIHLLLQALPKVLEVVPTAHLIIAGGGEYEREIDRLIGEAGVREHVTRFGWLDQHELVRLLSVSDIFVYPSIPHKGWAEQFGYSMAEASLMELPVVSTQSGSIADVVVDGRTGILVRPGDAGQLAIAMVQLGQDASLRERLGKAGRQYISEHFSHAVVARKFYEFFGSLVKRKRPQA